MERIIVNTNSPVIDVYSVSDNYLKKCFFDLNEPVDDEIIKYLDESGYFCILLNTNRDIFEGKTISDFRTLRTDGYWIWSADLNYYYEKFGFKWPQEFVSFSKVNGDSKLSASLVDDKLEQYYDTIYFLQNGIKHKDSKIYPVNEIELI